MRPLDYVNCYLSLYHYTRDDVAVPIGIRNYLQSGMGLQSTNAQQLKSRLYAAINRERGKPGPEVPATFDIFQYAYLKANLERVFMGKGAPDEIQDALWLMDRLDIVDQSSVNQKCDQHLGIDCGGFVANYWGMGRPDAGNPAPTGSTGFTPRMLWDMSPGTRRRTLGEV